MDILIVGLGVIGSTYGYLFQKAGHCTEHFIRKDSLKKSVKELQVELFDGRTKTTGEWTKGVYYVHHICKKRKYDFIFVSVPAGGITDVMNSLNEQEIQGTIILVCGIWYDHNELNKIMKGWKYILGYPVAGGNISDEVLNCCVFDHFMLEKEEKADIKNYKELIKLFYDCNVKLEIPYDMLEWIWIHMAINAGVITVAGKYGDINDTTASAEKLMNSLKELSEVVISIRETTKIIEARGVKLKHYKNELLPYKIPSKIAAVVMKKMFAKNLLTRKIMTLHSNINDLLYVCQNVNTCGKQYSVKAPVFYENCNITGLSKALSKRQNK